MTDGEALLTAAREGDLDRLRELLEQDRSLIQYRNELGQSAVLLAKYHRQLAAVEFLLQRGAELTVYEAAAVGGLQRVRELVDEDSSLLHEYSPDGFTPLALASFFGNVAVVEYLIDRGSDTNLASRNPMGVYPLHAAAAGRHIDIVRRLVKAGADVNARQQQGFTALHSAANNGDEEMVRFLLAHEADRDARSDAGQTPLDVAMTQGHEAVANLLAGDARSSSV